MENTGKVYRRVAEAFVFVSAALLGLFSSSAIAARQQNPASAQPGQGVSTDQAVINSLVDPARDAWRKSLLRDHPAPTTGCYKAAYPKNEWKPVACGKAPSVPYVVGSGTDWSPHVTSGSITAADGSFPLVSGLTSEKGSEGTANSFSLQLNTNHLSSLVCKGAADPNKCNSWQQFIYSNNGHVGFIEYWLVDWAKACPKGWKTFRKGCWRNSTASTNELPPVTAANIGKLSLSGIATTSGEYVYVGDGDAVYSAPGDNSLKIAASSGWHEAEFNVFGDCCHDQAVFNSGSTIVVRTTVANGTLKAPSCSQTGFTGETNNLNLTAAAGPPEFLQQSRIEFAESNAAGMPKKKCSAFSGMSLVGKVQSALP